MSFAITNVQAILLVVSVLVVGVGVLLSVRQWRRSAAVAAYERSIPVYPSLVVADTTSDELSSLGVGGYVFCPMTLFDRRLAHYWRLLVAPERLQEVVEQLRRHEVRIVDRFADGCVEEEIASCLHDKAFYDEHCCVCGSLRDSGSMVCRACRWQLIFPGKEEEG